MIRITTTNPTNFNANAAENLRGRRDYMKARLSWRGIFWMFVLV